MSIESTHTAELPRSSAFAPHAKKLTRSPNSDSSAMQRALVEQRHVGAMRNAGKLIQSELAATNAPLAALGIAIRLVRMIVELITVCTEQKKPAVSKT